LKWDEHILHITKRANSLLYTIKKAFWHFDKDLFVKLYKTYVRPLLEYGFQIWNPYFKKDINILERVQRRATKMVGCLRNYDYDRRLISLGLTLEKRRQRGDLIETYKILTGCYNVPGLGDMFVMNKNKNLRGHSLKLSLSSSTSNPRRHFLPNRVVDAWNELPETVISAPLVNSFKNRLNKHLTQVQ
jgi:ribonucleases P/MRP protein subunit RPP40